MVALAALDINTANNPVTFVSIDPHDRLGCQGNSRFKSRVTLIQRPVQSIAPGDIIKHLGPNSLLFVDSSHVFKFGSDVEYLMRQIYPRLPEGTFLHVHDIYTPYPVPRERMLKDKLFFNEQEHLESFLALNASFEIILPVHWLSRVSRKFQDFVETICEFQDLPGNSMYLRRVTGS